LNGFIWRRPLVVLAIGIAAFWLITLTRDLPSVETLKDYEPPITTRVYAGNGTVLGEFAHERRIFVPTAFIPKLVKEAFTSAEDRNFYNNPGIDPSGILRAAIKDVGLVLEGRRPQGASTITQQVARGFLLNSELKMARKVREAILAIRIDATYPKEKILELYLNEINLGQNSYGVGAAALNYFGKSLDELTISEVAFLAALPKSPAHYDPRFHHEAALDRRNWVIGQMAENNYITDEQARAAKAEPLVTQTRALGSQAADVDYYVEEVRRLLYKQYGGKRLYDSGLQVRASLDTRLQNYAVSALRTGLVRYDRRHGWRGAKKHNHLADWKRILPPIRKPGHRNLAAGGGAGLRGARMSRSVLPMACTGLITYDGYKWANRQLPGAVWGPRPTTARSRQAGRSSCRAYAAGQGRRVRFAPGAGGQRRHCGDGPHTGRRAGASGGFLRLAAIRPLAMAAPARLFVQALRVCHGARHGYTPPARCWTRPLESDQGPGPAAGGTKMSKRANIWSTPPCAAAWNCRAT
jgi:penicillin-binding protein 1A